MGVFRNILINTFGDCIQWISLALTSFQIDLLADIICLNSDDIFYTALHQNRTA